MTRYSRWSTKRVRRTRSLTSRSASRPCRRPRIACDQFQETRLASIARDSTSGPDRRSRGARAATRTETCPVCAHECAESFAGVYPIPHLTKTVYPVFYICGDCGLRFQSMDPDEDGSYYGDVHYTQEAE